MLQVSWRPRRPDAAVPLRPFTPRSCRSANRTATGRTVPLPLLLPPPAASGRFSRLASYRSLARAGPFPRFFASTRPSSRLFRPAVCTEDIWVPPGAAVLRRSAVPCAHATPWAHAGTHAPCVLAASCPFFYFSAKLKIGRHRPTRVPEEIFPTPAARLVAADVWPAPLRSERSRLYNTVLLLTEIVQ